MREAGTWGPGSEGIHVVLPGLTGELTEGPLSGGVGVVVPGFK